MLPVDGAPVHASGEFAQGIEFGSVAPVNLHLDAEIGVALIKPQFEVGREEVGKKGVVSDPALHRRVCDEVRDWIEGLGFTVQGVAQSPITGPEGNVEFLISAERSAPRD